MSGHGSISSPMHHEHASYYGDAAHSMHDQVGGQFISDSMGVVDPTATGTGDARGKDVVELGGGGLRVNAGALATLAGHVGPQGVAQLLSAAFVETGRGRVAMGLQASLPKGLGLPLPDGSTVEFKHALGTYGSRGAPGLQMVATRGRPDARPTVEDSVLNLSVPYPHGPLPLEVRIGAGLDAVRRSYDVLAQGEAFRGRSRPTDVGLDGPLKYPTSPPHVWAHAVEETGNIFVTLQHYKRAPFLGQLGRLIPGVAQLSDATKNSLPKIWVPAASSKFRSTSKLLVQMPVDANEHNRRIAGAMLKETWWAYLKRIFHRDILCTQRYDANGAIQFWPKRFYDRWFVGALGEETFSPHNIPNMKPGHMRFYERTRAFSSIFNSSLSFTDLLPLWMKGPISPPVREWFVGWPKIRNPMIFSGAVEVAQTQEQQRNTEYICRTEGGGIGVHSKTVVKDSRHRDETLLGRSFNASLNGTGSRRHTVRQSLILDSVYPLLPTADGHDLEPNDALNAAKRHPHNPAGLPEAWLNESLSEAHVAQCLRQVRARAQQAQRAKGGPSVERKDLRLTGEKVLDEYEWARKAAAMLSSRPGAVVSDERINYASGIRYIAEPVNIDEVRTRRELFVRCTDIQAAPAEFREFISVAGCFARLGPHPEQLEHVLMRLELRCDPSFRPAEVNQKLAKFGNIFGLGQPLPQVALPKVGEDEMLDSRDIHFEARIHRKDFFTLRQRLLDADLSTVGLPFGIDEASLKVMLDGGLRQNDSMDQWVKAIGDFVCKHPEPCQALQFLSHTLAKKMFTVAESSTTGTALRLNSEAQDLLNALGKPKRAGAEPYALLYQELAQACRLAERAKVALAQQHEDALIGARSKEDAAATFRLMGARLQTFKSDIFAKYGITQQQLCEYVIAKGIATEDDMFVCLHVKLEDFVQRTLGDLQHADTHHLNEIQLARFNKRIGQLSAAQQIIEATRREQARRLADMEAA